jgi:cytoskeletal protein RodZ
LLTLNRLGWLALGLILFVSACSAPDASPQAVATAQESPTKVIQPEPSATPRATKSVENALAENRRPKTPTTRVVVAPTEVENATTEAPTASVETTPTEVKNTPAEEPVADVEATSKGMGSEKAEANQGPSEEQLRLLASLKSQGAAPELLNEVWLNSEPLRLADLRGKVILVEFWTFG